MNFQIGNRIRSRNTCIGFLNWLVALLALVFIATFIILALGRLTYPFELEWIEGVSIDQIRWILQGHLIYEEPSKFFIPLAYNPLFFYISAFVAKFVGIGFIAPRFISILATLGCFLILYLIVSQDSGHPLPGIVAAGIYAASFRFTGAWMDLAKTDSLCLFLLIAGFFVSRRSLSHRMIVASGLLYVLAYFTKQVVLPIILGMACLSLAESRGRLWLGWVLVGIVGGVFFWTLDIGSNGWFSFYSLDVISQYDHIPDVYAFWQALLRQLWPEVLASLFLGGSIIVGLRNDHWGNRQHLGKNLALGTALILTSWGIFLRIVWSYDNGFMPACLGLALLTGLAFGQAMTMFREMNGNIMTAILNAGMAVLLLLQFGLLYYNPLKQLPNAENQSAGEQFIHFLSQLPGQVLVFNHGYVNYLAGKQSYFTSFTYSDVLSDLSAPHPVDERRRLDAVKQVVEQSIAQQLFDWVILDEPQASWLPYYLYYDKIIDRPGVLYPVTGAKARPESLMIKNPVARGGLVPITDPAWSFLFNKGWSDPEKWGRWAVGTQSEIPVALERGYNYKLMAGVFPFCPKNAVKQVMDIVWDDIPIGKYVFTSCDQASISLNFPADRITGRVSNLVFRFEDATSPAEVGLSGDQRPLAVGFISLEFVREIW